MKTLLQNKHTRRNFLLSILFLFLLILVVKYLVLPNYEFKVLLKVGEAIEIEKNPSWLTLTTKFLDSLLISLTVTISIGLFLFYIEIPEEEKKIEVIEPFKIGEYLEKERKNSQKWYFNGGMGRFTRETTLPDLSNIASNNNRHIALNISIIDPQNEELCEKYSSYRSSLKSSKKNSKVWSAKYVQQEVLATIISIKIYQKNNQLLIVKLFLKNNFSTIRLDFGTNLGMITKEDPKEPAILCKTDSFLFRTYLEEIYQTEKEYFELANILDRKYDFNVLSVHDVKSIITSLNLKINFENSDYTEILNIVKKGTSPYG